ncbi:hypothetical protein Pmar_PMAR015895, partial [Perkinsus marinus ATCC 50983]
MKLEVQFFTDNSANFFRLRKAQQYVRDENDDSKDIIWPSKSLDIPQWESKVLLGIAKKLALLNGTIYHLSGRHNPADAFSRGTPLTTLPHEDAGLKLAVEVFRRREGLPYDVDTEHVDTIGSDQ